MFCTDQRRSDPNPDPRVYLIRNPQIIRIRKDMWGMVGMVWLVWYGLDTKFLSLCQRQAILYNVHVLYCTVY